MHQVVLLIGGNLGNRENLLQEALELLSKKCTLKTVSSLYETEAWGDISDKPFLNQACMVWTEMAPLDFLKLTQEIENQLGRKREEKWGNRTMDIDLLYYDDAVYQDEKLSIPHPWLAERRFALVPVVEILPDYVHPVYQLTNRELLLRCTDEGEVRKYP